MFSSSNSNGDSDCFRQYNGSISCSSFQFGSTSSPVVLEEDQFLVDHLLFMPQEQQKFLFGHEAELPLLDHHDFVDGMIEAGNLIGDQVSNAIPSQNHKKKDGVGSSNYENKKDSKPVKKPPNKRIRTGKKDRHSKICTAQGLRDRRMRLSLQVARKFFDLQETLGFDKASNTIEWLFNMSKNAIMEVMGSDYSRMDGPQRSFVDKCGGINNPTSGNETKSIAAPSPCEKNEDTYSSKCKQIATNQTTYKDEGGCNKLKSVNRQCRSTSKKLKSYQISFCPRHTKDARDKARARARERTLEIMRLRVIQDPDQRLFTTCLEEAAATNPSNITTFSEQIGSCSPFEQVDEISGAQSQSLEDLILHADWEIEGARFYSSYIFDTTEHHHAVRTTTTAINLVQIKQLKFLTWNELPENLLYVIKHASAQNGSFNLSSYHFNKNT
uniref:Uncharacterized protein n=1 Tax=Kalanchoe fedtschenkoi TaxID=63787 RepID=A0A7N0UE01_KALFE